MQDAAAVSGKLDCPCALRIMRSADVKGAQAILETLHRGGVDTIFANPGTSEMALVRALEMVRA